MDKKFGLSIVVLVKDEETYLRRLIAKLASFNYGDLPVELVVQYDETNPEWKSLAKTVGDICIAVDAPWMHKTLPYPFKGNFSEFKNHYAQDCYYSWILQLDADEYPSDNLMATIQHIIVYGDSDSQVDAYALPRANRVIGLTEEHAKKWGWNLTLAPTVVGHPPMKRNGLDEYANLQANNGGMVMKGEEYTIFVDSLLINWPDFQIRLYRNREDIKWIGKVHERLATDKVLPLTNDFSMHCYLVHDKDIDRQEKQNTLYDRL